MVTDLVILFALRQVRWKYKIREIRVINALNSWSKKIAIFSLQSIGVFSALLFC